MEGLFSQIIREKILAQPELTLLTRRDAGLPRIGNKAVAVIGMRRSGKTCFLHQQRAERIAAGQKAERLVYFNFEDERLAGMESKDLHLIPSTHLRLFPEPSSEPVTFFLDEIQLVTGWETFVRRLLDEGNTELFLSGSSAKLLSREIASSMRGRAWEVVIHPFSFHEYLRHHGQEPQKTADHMTAREQSLMDRRFADYLAVGGFPEAQDLDATERRQLIQGYVDVLMLRDVIERHGNSKVSALRLMSRRLLGNAGRLFSVTKFEADLKSQGIPVGRETLYELLSHLEDAFLLRAVPIATDSEKRRQVNPRKIYPIDHAFGAVFERSQKSNLGHRLEVAVHNELIRRWAETAYLKTEDGYEIDFLSRNADGSQWQIQVCANVDDPETLARECRAFQAAAREYPADRQLLLTAESRLPFPEVPDKIEILPAWRWMLEAKGNDPA